MTPEQLKASILQYAIQGKLVEQRPEEGTGEELYRQIQAEKQRLIKEGKIKKEKPLPEIAEDEIPFDIPESWKWVLLDKIVCKPIKRGKSPTYTAQSETLVFAQKCNTKKGYIDLSLALCLDESKLSKYPEEEFMRDKDIVINSTGGGTMGRVGFYQCNDNPEHKPIVPDSHVTVVRVLDNVYAEFILYAIKTYQPYMERQGSGSTNQIELNAMVIRTLQIPLPPLAEQKRIVAKIEELLPYVDRYAAAYKKLEQFNAKFPEDMKKSILQYAIQGKLVEQRPEEGTGEELYRQIQAEKHRLIKEGKIKKEKPLPEIAEDEIPFEIPESWKWCRLSDVIDVRDGTHDSPKYVPVGIPLVTSKNLVNGAIDYSNVKYITLEDADKINARSMVDDNDILFAMIGSIGNPVLVKKDREFCIKNMALFKRFSNTEISMRYAYWFLFYAQYKLKKEASGGVQSFISLSRFREYLIPLPPVAEQNRIVAKLEEILPLCERLK